MIHPAKYSNTLLPYFAQLLPADRYPLLLDPFAGIGKLRLVRPDCILVEIEREWAMEGKAIQGNTLNLPFASESFDAICTSPCYGNRMADHHYAKDGSHRITYTHILGHNLHPNNSGSLQWGPKYRDFHRRAWKECFRVLKSDGRFILNCKDHYRHGKIQSVTAWHVYELSRLGLSVEDVISVIVPGHRYGENAALRVPHEYIVVFIKKGNKVCSTS